MTTEVTTRLRSRPLLGDAATRVTVAARREDGSPAAVFLCRRRGENGWWVEEFHDVCSPDDLEEYAVGTPREGAVADFHRASELDLTFPSLEFAAAAVQAILERVAAHDAAVLAAATLELGLVARCGEDPGASASVD